MKTLLSLAFALFAATAFAQSSTKDTTHRFKYNQPLDTATDKEYGMRLYDTRMARYMRPDTASKQNPYYFADKRKKKKH